METVLYKFNSDNQKTDVIKCRLNLANDLFEKELALMQDQASLYNYMDITINGKMVKSSLNK